jgi:hypothetical protein
MTGERDVFVVVGIPLLGNSLESSHWQMNSEVLTRDNHGSVDDSDILLDGLGARPNISETESGTELVTSITRCVIYPLSSSSEM